jgi:hypothetical protein
MARDAQSAKRLADLQRQVAEQKRLEWIGSQRTLAETIQRSEAVAKALDGHGLAWQLFPDMSRRHLGKLISERVAAKENADRAALIAMQESKRLETLERRSAILQRSEEQRKDDDERLENATRVQRASLPQA